MADFKIEKLGNKLANAKKRLQQLACKRFTNMVACRYEAFSYFFHLDLKDLNTVKNDEVPRSGDGA